MLTEAELHLMTGRAKLTDCPPAMQQHTIGVLRRDVLCLLAAYRALRVENVALQEKYNAMYRHALGLEEQNAALLAAGGKEAGDGKR